MAFEQSNITGQLVRRQDRYLATPAPCSAFHERAIISISHILQCPKRAERDLRSTPLGKRPRTLVPRRLAPIIAIRDLPALLI